MMVRTSEELLLAVRNKETNDNLLFYIIDGALIDYQDPKGISALMEAAINLDIRIMGFLLQHGATISLQDREHKTALHHIYIESADHNEADLLPAISFLLDNGANPNQDCEGNDSLLNWAAKKGYTRIMNHIFTKCDYKDDPDKLWTALTLAEDEGQESTITLLNSKLDKLNSVSADSHENTVLYVNYQ